LNPRLLGYEKYYDTRSHVVSEHIEEVWLMPGAIDAHAQGEQRKDGEGQGSGVLLPSRVSGHAVDRQFGCERRGTRRPGSRLCPGISWRHPALPGRLVACR
jgi:hypothetical protein